MDNKQKSWDDSRWVHWPANAIILGGLALIVWKASGIPAGVLWWVFG